MPKSEKEEVLQALTARVFASMLEELVMDATLQSHQEVLRSKSLCPVCNTRCNAIHTPGVAGSSNEASASGHIAASRANTPMSTTSSEFASKGQFGGTGTSTPNGTKNDGGTTYFECVSCTRQIASNRYAPHLSSCMGLGNARRGAMRGSAKPKQPSDAGRSMSPGSDGHQSDDKGKGKSKGKKKAADESDFSLKRKRLGSPQISPNKKPKKGKVSASPVSRIRADPDQLGLSSNSHYSPLANSQSKIPSKLRDSSTASFMDRSSTSSRESSPEPAYAEATPNSSFSSQQSPVRPLAATAKAAASIRGRPHVTGTGPPKRPSPPRPPQIQVPDYMEIDHANETGSSTDTDSD